MKPSQYGLIIFMMGVLLFSGCGELLSHKEIEKRDGMTRELISISSLTLQEINAKVGDDPYNPLRERVPELEESLDYAQKVRAGDVLFDLEQMVERFNRIKAIRANLRQSIYLVLETDVSFPPGKYMVTDLLGAGKKVLDESVEKVISFTADLRKQIPMDTLVITIATVGYADGMQPSKELEFEIADGIGGVVTPNKAQMKKLLNTELSRRRSQTVNQYIFQHVKNKLDIPRVVLGEPRITGLGEEYPSKNISPPFQQNDSRRRICKIYGNVLTLPYIDPKETTEEIIP